MKREEIIEKWESRFNLQEGSQASRIVYSRALLHEFLTDLRTLPESQSVQPTPMTEEHIRSWWENQPDDELPCGEEEMKDVLIRFYNHLLSKVTEEKKEWRKECSNCSFEKKYHDSEMCIGCHEFSHWESAEDVKEQVVQALNGSGLTYSFGDITEVNDY